MRLNPKLASHGGTSRGGLASQALINRNSLKGGHSYGTEGNDEVEAMMPTQDHVKLMNKTGGFAYPGQPLKVSTASVLGQTLNKFELGEKNSSKLKTFSGNQYYK